MYLVRKITRAKWDRKERLAKDEIPADAVTADLRTSNNALSLWSVEQENDLALEDVVLALAARFERIDKVDVVWLEETKLNQSGVKLEQTEGITPIEKLRDRHMDATQLDFIRLGLIAKQVVEAINVDHWKRFNKRQVIKLIAAAVRNEDVALENLQEDVQIAVNKYFGLLNRICG